ncbi:transglycosylase [Streptomyces sp. CB02923]|uniref:LysM peptidoglycan-binding domain-containing protein n=1 Tax=Streptomyces sp. CB02923 TaxID=1718985 RepID=UPI00093B472F|nr:transglycosylase family protein [Streptomyces sp. CB02923]OKH97691.1 transglycosylase [Streptomyces sp. CB02923]
MRSGNGRHRRPRQAPAIFVTAGVAGGALAMPLLAASSANAADSATWDRVAQCESSGTWSANGGNGFYGGLQLTQEMWDRHGGPAYASRPDLASRSQQIAVAESILAARGPDAWPSCAVNAGLKQGGSGPDVDPGGTPTPTPEPSSPSPSSPSSPSTPPSSGPSGTPKPGGTGSPKPKPSPTGPAGPQDPSRTPDPSGTGRTEDPSRPADPATPGDGASTGPTAPPSQGKHRGEPGDEKKPGTGTGSGTGSGGAGDADRSGGGHPSRGGDAHRTDPGAPGDYTVRPGDNLSVIAEGRGVSGGWPALYEANKDVIGGDPDLIHPGQRLDLDG